MLVHSTGKETHWYFMEAIGNGIIRESQHFTDRKDAETILRHQLVWIKSNGENTCEVCKKGG